MLSSIIEQKFIRTLSRSYANFSLLKETASKTNTKIVGSIIDLILESVNESAEIDGSFFLEQLSFHVGGWLVKEGRLKKTASLFL